MIAMNVKQSVFINLPAEEIFAYMSNLENLVDWSSAVTATRKLSLEAIHVGATACSTIHFWGKCSEITFEIVEYNPSRYLTIKSISSGPPCLFSYQFELAKNGGTTISLEAVIHLTKGIIAQPEQAITSAIRRQIAFDLLTLKDLLEARASTCIPATD